MLEERGWRPVLPGSSQEKSKGSEADEISSRKGRDRERSCLLSYALHLLCIATRELYLTC